MKLATYKEGSRDGQLVVVSRDLSTAHFVNGIATRLQQVLDDWNFLSPQLQDLYTTLNQGKARHAFAFDPAMCMAPLPRAYARLVAQSGGEAKPSLRQGASDALMGPRDDLWVASAEAGADFEVGLAVVTGDIERASAPAQALEGVRLLMLGVDWHWRGLEDSGASPVHSQPASGFAPVAVTPDELGDAWQGGRAHLSVSVQCQQRRIGVLDSAAGMALHFGQWLSLAARERSIGAGTVLCSGALRDPNVQHGHASVLQRRQHEQAEQGQPQTAWLGWGDVLQVDARSRDGHSVFGAIEHAVVEPL